MKKFSYIAIFLIFVGYEISNAQDQKIGFVDSDVILQNMPEYSGIEQRLTLLADNWRQEISTLEEELNQLEDDFEAREILYTDTMRDERLQEIEAKKRQLEQLTEARFGPEGDYFSRQKELLEPVQRQIFEAINRVAERESFDFVFDRSQDTKFLFARPQWNLTEDVMLELGLESAGN